MNPKEEPAFPTTMPGFCHPGMTLRDYFAGQALPAIIQMTTDLTILAAKVGVPNPDQLIVAEQYASTSYEVADAMLKARSKP